MRKRDEKLLINLGLIAVAYFGIIKPILNKVGITKSSTDRMIEAQGNLPNNQNPFSPLFYQTAEARRNGALLLYTSTADQLAKRIYDALGVFTDDESAIYSVFRQLKTQSQVSFLSDKFQQRYRVDLLDYLKRGYNPINPASGLNADELRTVIDIVNTLPKYKK